MDAVEYLKQKKRMTKDCKTGCDNCPFTYTKTGQTCINFQYDHPEKAVAIVGEWAKEHPLKTYKSVFLESFPNAKLEKGGHPYPCITYIYGEASRPHDCGLLDCNDCWNSPYKEIEEV